MVTVYKCNKCNKMFYNKNDFKRHLNRKTSCVIPLKNADTFACSQCNKTFTRIDSLNRHIKFYCKSNLNDLNNNNDSIINGENSTINVDLTNENLNIQLLTQKKIMDPQKKFTCKYCQKIYTRQDNYNRHLKQFCKMKNEKDDKETILKEILDEMKQLRLQNELLTEKIQKLEGNNSINNITNNNNNQTNNTQINNNNNFNIVAFGKEKIDSIISDDVCKLILKRGFEAIPQLIEWMHFNKNRPQYHNCYISNLRSKYAIIYDGNNWKLEDAIEVINILRDDKRVFLENKFEDFYDSLDEDTKKKFHRFLLEADSDIVINRYKNDIRLLLYNKKGVVLDTRNKMEKKQITDNCKNLIK